jgi:hypothetical protein
MTTNSGTNFDQPKRARSSSNPPLTQPIPRPHKQPLVPRFRLPIVEHLSAASGEVGPDEKPQPIPRIHKQPLVPRFRLPSIGRPSATARNIDPSRSHNRLLVPTGNPSCLDFECQLLDRRRRSPGGVAARECGSERRCSGDAAGGKPSAKACGHKDFGCLVSGADRRIDWGSACISAAVTLGR